MVIGHSSFTCCIVCPTLRGLSRLLVDFECKVSLSGLIDTPYYRIMTDISFEPSRVVKSSSLRLICSWVTYCELSANLTLLKGDGMGIKTEDTTNLAG